MKARFRPISAAAVAGFVLSAACSAQVPAASTAGALDEQPRCNADKAESLVGRVASQVTLDAAQRLSASSILRIVKPGQPISMDYMTNRLTVEVDEKNRILRLYCS